MYEKSIQCSIQGCEKPVHARALCSMHYQRMKPERETREQRFWKKVEKTETCWLWTGAKTKRGYGLFWNGKSYEMAYRYSYKMVVGPIPDGFDIDHLCRTPLCVRPDHLEPVTHRDNLLRGKTVAAFHAAKTHCPRGHPYAGDNVYLDRKGARRCRACKRDYDREHYAEQYARRKRRLADARAED